MDTNTNENQAEHEKIDCFDYERFAAEERAAAIAAGGPAAEATKAPRRQRTKKSEGSEIYDWIQSLVAALLICVLVFSFLVRVIGIIGSSMVPTFHNADSVVISNLFYEPEAGDIVVLRKEAFQKEPIIKRVVATAGQTVDIDFQAGIVYVDGAPLDEPYVNEQTFDPLDFNGAVTVPENHVFVMGDNRNHSTDSRNALIGCVDNRYILGKVLLKIFPLSQFGAVK